MDKKLFTQGEVNRVFDHIPTSTLLFWAKNEVITWSGESRDGRGVHRLYSREDLYLLGLVEELTILNLPLITIKDEVVNPFFHSPTTKSSLWVSGKKHNHITLRKIKTGRGDIWTRVHGDPCQENTYPSFIAMIVVDLAEIIKKVETLMF